jgi:zinc transport system substrate-binding protein
MKNTIGIIIGVTLLAGGAYFFISNQDAETNTVENQALSIATSFYPLQFALERVVGDFGTVTNIGAGRDPHDFEPSTQDMVRLQRSDLVVLQGADFEPWGDDVMARLEADNVPVLLATADIELHEGGHDHGDEKSPEEEHADESHDDEHEHGSYDPHTWLDPVLFSEMVGHLTEKIATLDPSNAAVYQENAAALQVELAALNTEYADRLASCDLDKVITSHDAFGYLADRYGFKAHSIAGLSTQDTPSVTTLAELRAEAVEGIGAILLEENSITAYGETLARETGLQTLSLNPIAHIIPANETYLTLMRKNLDSFATALICNE